MTKPKDIPSPFDELQKILIDMRVPLDKMGNVKWLRSNLHTLNSRHPSFKQAIYLLDKLTYGKVNPNENVYNYR